MKNNVILIFLFALIIAGCGTKRQYFEPETITGNVRFSGSMPSDIKEAGLFGASLENGQVISADGVEPNKILGNEDYFIGKFDDKYIVITKNGNLNIKLEDGTIFYEKTLPSMIAAASIEGDSLALITADNTLYLIQVSDDKVLYTQKMDDISAVDSRVAVPYFLGSLVVFPTLDGKLTIVDRYSGELIRNVVVSAERHFNNLIFLDVVGDRMLAATAKRAISINPSGINYIDEDIKDAALLSDRFFIFTKDGNVIMTDLNLQVIKEKKFPFAIFSGIVLTENNLNIIEKKGHLIRTNLNLENIEYLTLPSEIKSSIYIGKNKMYYENKYIDFSEY
jgi:outer membrane protein assembly factor BamB